jgi:hypothetical protein
MSERVGQPPPTVWVVLKESQNNTKSAYGSGEPLRHPKSKP